MFNIISSESAITLPIICLHSPLSLTAFPHPHCLLYVPHNLTNCATNSEDIRLSLFNGLCSVQHSFSCYIPSHHHGLSSPTQPFHLSTSIFINHSDNFQGRKFQHHHVAKLAQGLTLELVITTSYDL